MVGDVILGGLLEKGALGGKCACRGPRNLLPRAPAFSVNSDRTTHALGTRKSWFRELNVPIGSNSVTVSEHA